MMKGCYVTSNIRLLRKTALPPELLKRHLYSREIQIVHCEDTQAVITKSERYKDSDRERKREGYKGRGRERGRKRKREKGGFYQEQHLHSVRINLLRCCGPTMVSSLIPIASRWNYLIYWLYFFFIFLTHSLKSMNFYCLFEITLLG